MVVGLYLSSSMQAQPQKEQLDILVQQARAAEAAGKLDEALRLFEAALALDSSSAGVWEALGSILYEQGKFSDARDALRRAVSLRAEAGDSWALLGLSEYQVREYERALQSLYRARTYGVSEPELGSLTSYYQAILLSRFQQYEGSFLILFDLAYREPENPRVVEGLGLAVLEMPFLPEEVPEDRRELVRLAGEVMASLADFRLDAARQKYARLTTLYPGTPNLERVDPDRLLQAEPGGGFPVHASPEIVSAADVEIGADDLVIGVVKDDLARAYPVNYMNGPMNEAVNDQLGGTPIMATW